MKKKLLTSDKVSKLGFKICAMFSIFAVIAIIGFILYASIPALREIGLFHFLFGTLWAPTKDFLPASARFGIFPMIVSSFAVTFGALIFGGIIGVFTAVFIVYFCPKKLKGLFVQIINLLAGIPSIIYGFFGLVVLTPMLSNISTTGSGKGLFASSIILGIMILPTVASITRNALESVPKTYYEGALALGATKEQTIFKIVVPAAKSGIVTGLVLGVGRAIGETMAVMMIAGNSPIFPTGLFSSIRTLTTNIVLEMSYSTGLHRSALIATGFVLLIFVFLLNISLGFVKKNNTDKRQSRKKLPKTIATEVIAIGNDTAVSQSTTNNFLKFCKKINILLFNNCKAVSNKKTLQVKNAEKAMTTDNCKVVSEKNTLQTAVTQQEDLCDDCASDDRSYNFTKGGQVQITLKYISIAISAIVATILISIIIFILAKGLPHISFNLLFGESGNAGMTLQPAFMTTGMIILLSLAIALPIGIGSAIYLVEYAKKGSKLVKIIRLFTDTLAGIPSIVFGLFGMIVFCGAFGGTSILAGSLTMALIILPTIIRSTEESLMAVPDSLREGSLALGASKARTIFKIVLPSALSGILTSVVLSIGRIVGESAALIYTAGAVAYSPLGFMDSGSTFAVMMWMFAGEGLYINNAYATAAVLLIIVATLNTIVFLMEKKIRNKRNGGSSSENGFFNQLISKIKEKTQKNANTKNNELPKKIESKAAKLMSKVSTNVNNQNTVSKTSKLVSNVSSNTSNQNTVSKTSKFVSNIYSNTTNQNTVSKTSKLVSNVSSNTTNQNTVSKTSKIVSNVSSNTTNQNTVSKELK